MNPISEHISYLLLTCRKVDVPGLGAFSAYYDRASFDSDFGVFYPSRIRIIFKNNVEGKSTLLRESIKRKLKIDGAEAEKLIEQFVKILLLKLKKNRYCRLEGIGYLIYNNGTISLKDTFWKRSKYPNLTTMRV